MLPPPPPALWRRSVPFMVHGVVNTWNDALPEAVVNAKTVSARRELGSHWKEELILYAERGHGGGG